MTPPKLPLPVFSKIDNECCQLLLVTEQRNCRCRESSLPALNGTSNGRLGKHNKHLVKLGSKDFRIDRKWRFKTPHVLRGNGQLRRKLPPQEHTAQAFEML